MTQAEVEVERPRADRSVTVSPNRTVNLQASQNAATLAAEQAASRQSSSNTSAKTSFVAPATAQTPLLERPTRFTTVEEEESRLRSQSQRSWIVVAAQLGSLAAVLALLAGGAAYLSRPLSADKLYSMIDSRVERDDDASIAKVENEVNDFLERFPDDARGDTLRNYKERIDLAKLKQQTAAANAGWWRRFNFIAGGAIVFAGLGNCWHRPGKVIVDVRISDRPVRTKDGGHNGGGGTFNDREDARRSPSERTNGRRGATRQTTRRENSLRGVRGRMSSYCGRWRNGWRRPRNSCRPIRRAPRQCIKRL